jgi:3-dehydroquinate synthase
LRSVGINHGNLKNRLGAYHAPMITFLDFNMLRTLPEGQVRNGFAGMYLSCNVEDVGDG